MSFSSLKASSNPYQQVFESETKVGYLLVVPPGLDLNFKLENKNTLKVTGTASSLIVKKLQKDSKFSSNKDSESSRLYFSDDINFIGCQKITCHQQHCSYWLEFSKLKRDDFLVSILLDPGHGGVDPGAVHYSHREKDITLAMALNIKSRLQIYGVRVLLTRSHDTFLSLKERNFISTKLQPDCFLSLHADSYPDKEVFGASAFVWGGASRTNNVLKHLVEHNEDGRYLGTGRRSESASLYPLLNELVGKVSIHNSSIFSQLLLETLAPILPLHSQEIQKGPFYVLTTKAFPCVLLELGFLSHRESARRLVSTTWQDKISQAVTRGIVQYFHTVRPGQLENKFHLYTVKKGDTLWRLSKRFSIELETLKQDNNLSHNNIVVGQTLNLRC